MKDLKDLNGVKDLKNSKDLKKLRDLEELKIETLEIIDKLEVGKTRNT